ncbi:MAG: hypothetical protein IKE70_03925 [Bacilli bacterium]|nr:hypothetical protein [Bacilli bacterium]
MNKDLQYYTACFKLAAYETITNSSIENEIHLNKELTAKTYWFYFENDIAVGDVSQFIVEFYKEEELLDRIIFNVNKRKGTILEKNLDEDHLEENMQLVKKLEPKVPVKILKHRAKLDKEEQNLVIRRVDDLEHKWYQLLNKKKKTLLKQK